MGTSNSNSNANSQKSNDNNNKNNNNNANTNTNTHVMLNVYDLTPLNNYLYWFGFGIFHSGIEVHGKEYGFGSHDFPSSGVFEVEPKKCPGFIYRCSVPLGQVNMHPSEFRKFIENLASSLCSCLLPDSIQATTVKQLPEYHGCSEDGVTKTLSTSTPCESIELDDEQEKSLLSPLAGTDNNVSIVKEAQTTQVK